MSKMWPVCIEPASYPHHLSMKKARDATQSDGGQAIRATRLRGLQEYLMEGSYLPDPTTAATEPHELRLGGHLVQHQHVTGGEHGRPRVLDEEHVRGALLARAGACRYSIRRWSCWSDASPRRHQDNAGAGMYNTLTASHRSGSARGLCRPQCKPRHPAQIEQKHSRVAVGTPGSQAQRLSSPPPPVMIGDGDSHSQGRTQQRRRRQRQAQRGRSARGAPGHQARPAAPPPRSSPPPAPLSHGLSPSSRVRCGGGGGGGRGPGRA